MSDKLRGSVNRWQNMDNAGGTSTSGPGGWPNAPLGATKGSPISQNAGEDAYVAGNRGSVSAERNSRVVNDSMQGHPSGGLKSSPPHTHVPDGAIATSRVSHGPLEPRGKLRYSSSAHASRHALESPGVNKGGEEAQMTDQLKGTRLLGPFEDRRSADYSPGPRPQLREPRKDSLSREGEERTIKYARPTVGRIQYAVDDNGRTYLENLERKP